METMKKREAIKSKLKQENKSQNDNIQTSEIVHRKTHIENTLARKTQIKLKKKPM